MKDKIPPKDVRKGMFFGAYIFDPKNDITKDELLNIMVEIFRRVFKDPKTKKPYEISQEYSPGGRALALMKFLEPRVEPEEFENLPKDIKRHFQFIDREGNKK